jgi:hypothetical protein
MLWYLFDRTDINENIIPYTDDDNNIHMFEEPDDLWEYVKLLIEEY